MMIDYDSLTDAYYNSSLSLGNRGYISPFSISPICSPLSSR